LKWYQLGTGQFGYPKPDDGLQAMTYEYEPGIGCKTCRIGKRQTAPFRFSREPKVTNKGFTGLNWIFDEIFCINSVRALIEENELTGITFSRPVVHRTHKPFENWWQMHVDGVIDDLVLTKGLTSERCEMPTEATGLKMLRAIGSRLAEGPFCGAVKYNYPRGYPYELDGQKLLNAPDVVRSGTWFGSGASSNRPIFASERFCEIAKASKLRGLFMDEVVVV